MFAVRRFTICANDDDLEDAEMISSNQLNTEAVTKRGFGGGDEVGYDWLNMSFDTYKLKCKELFLQ